MTKVSSFYHSSNWRTTDSSCLAVLRGVRCVCGASSSYEQTSPSIKLVFSSIVADLGWPESSFLFMVPLSLKRFKSLFMDM